MTHRKTPGKSQPPVTRGRRLGLALLAVAAATLGLVAWRDSESAPKAGQMVDSEASLPTDHGRERGSATGAVAAPQEARKEPKANTPSAGRARAERALTQALPTWNQSINQVPEDVRRNQFDPKKYDPLELAKLVTEEAFSFSEVRVNGRTVYRNARQDSVVKVNDGLGYWKYISPPKPATQGDKAFSDVEAERDSLKLFERFGLPPGEMGHVRAAGIAGMSAEGSAPTIMGRHARVARQVNGLPVEESTLMVTYNGDGSVARLERRWPSFELDGAEVVTREQAVADLAEQLEGEFELAPDSEAGASLRYVLDEETGIHEPILRVKVERPDTDEVTSTVEYSLVTRELLSTPSNQEENG